MFKYFCKNCDYSLSENTKQCPRCGSNSKYIETHFKDEMSVFDLLQTKLKRKIKNKTKVVHKQKIGSELYKNTNRWQDLIRIVDSIKYKYLELIIDKESKNIIKDVKEDLRKHKGHGSDKNNKQK